MADIKDFGDRKRLTKTVVPAEGSVVNFTLPADSSQEPTEAQRAIEKHEPHFADSESHAERAARLRVRNSVRQQVERAVEVFARAQFRESEKWDIMAKKRRISMADYTELAHLVAETEKAHADLKQLVDLFEKYKYGEDILS